MKSAILFADHCLKMIWEHSKQVLKAMAGLILVSGCHGPNFTTAARPVGTSMTPAGDAVADFAAQAGSHDETQVVLADGQTATLRMVRHYFAASGRDCREILVRTNSAQASRLVCKADDGNWMTAQSLLRGG